MPHNEPSTPRGRGRPRLGVIAREVTLLPSHWEWLATQTGGASVALRKLVEAARRANRDQDETRRTREAAYGYMASVAGDFPGFEEASRALFAGDEQRFRAQVSLWPQAARERALTLAFPTPNPLPVAIDALIPPEKREAIARAADAVFAAAAIDAATRLPGGAAGAAVVLRITVQGRDYLLRIEGPPSPLRDPARHYACLKIAADAGVAPRLLYADAANGIAISEFIAATPGGASPVSPAARLRALTGTVRALHNTPVFPPLMPYLDCIDLLIAQFRAADIVPTETVREHFRLYDELCAAYPRHDPDCVSSHNDLNPSNVLFVAERPWIVDWESAFAADRYVDIAALANFFAADEADEDTVLQTYFGPTLNDYHRARLFLMRQVNRMFYAMVLLNSVAAAEPTIRLTAANLATPRFHEVRSELASLATHDGRLRFGCIFLDDMLAHLRSPRFAAAIAVTAARTPHARAPR